MIRISFIFALAAVLGAGCVAGGDDAKGGERWLKQVKTIDLPEVEGRIDHFALDAKGGRLLWRRWGVMRWR